MEQTVKTYKDQRTYQKDVPRMLAEGWVIQSQTTYQPRSGVGRFIALGGIGALVFKPKMQVMVTYTRNTPAQSQQPQGAFASIQEQIILAKSEQKPGMTFMEQVRAARDQARNNR